MNHAIVCPECHARQRPEFIRCTVCHAYMVDSSPWRSDHNLYALPLTVLLWWVLDALLRLREVAVPGGEAGATFTMPTADILGDPISRTILAMGIYGMVLLFFKWRVTRRQVAAFRVVRTVCAEARNQLSEATLLAARDRITAARLGPFNDFIAYHRLQWLLLSLHSDREGRLELLEAQRAHAATDWDALESAYASIQYLVWLLPTTGFLGTVWGMTVALQSFSGMISKTSTDLSFTTGLIGTAQGLGTAFHTTVVGLALVIPVLAVATLLRRSSQNFLERADKYFVRMAATLVNEPVAALATAAAPLAAGAPASASPVPPPLPVTAAPAVPLVPANPSMPTVPSPVPSVAPATVPAPRVLPPPLPVAPPRPLPVPVATGRPAPVAQPPVTLVPPTIGGAQPLAVTPDPQPVLPLAANPRPTTKEYGLDGPAQTTAPPPASQPLPAKGALLEPPAGATPPPEDAGHGAPPPH